MKTSREEILHKLSHYCASNRLGEVYGIIEGISNDKKYRSITFCRARTIDGEIRVYSQKFINIQFQTAFSTVKHKDSVIFDSVKNAISFLNAAFVNRNEDIDPYSFVKSN